MNAYRCPDEAAWSEFLADGVLTSDEQPLLDAERSSYEELSQHLQGCQNCRQLLEGLMTLARPPVEQVASGAEATDANAEHLSALKQRVLRLMETPQPAAAVMDTEGWGETRARRELPQRVGRFQIQGLLGEGGFGLVLLAHDPLLRRQVALKLPRALLVADSHQEVRFLREARAAAGLTHPNIVPVYEIGREGDQYFFSMGYVDGESLYERIQRDGPLSPALAARLLEQIAQAVEYAHGQGVVHRDLKPQNVMLRKSRETRDETREPANVRPALDSRLSSLDFPLVSDFGLAKHTSEAEGLTVSGQVMGTPSFMSPEQAQGRLDEVGPHSDVYSLGAMLYHLLTGRPPFSAAGALETLKLVTEAEPVPPRKLNPVIPPDLETIALKCLDKSPQRRYGTARELAEELRRYQDGEPILARPITHTERVWRSVRRRPAIAGLSAAVVLVLLIGTAVSLTLLNTIWANQLNTALDEAQEATLSGYPKEANRAIGHAEQLGAPAWRIKMLRGQAAYFGGEYGTAVENLQEAAEDQPDNVAAKSMFAAACVAAGKWEQYDATMLELDRLKPVTQEDHLFKGLAESYFKPQQGLDSLDYAVELHNSAIARLIRAEVRCSLAGDTAKVGDAVDAVDDARNALVFLPNHASTLRASLKTNLIAAGIFRNAKVASRAEEAEKQCQLAAEALEKFADLPFVVVERARYLQVLGQNDKARELLKDAEAKRRGEPLLVDNLALALYRDNQWREALKLLDGAATLTDNAQWLKVWLLMEKGDLSTAQARCKEIENSGASGLEALFRPCLRLLLGQRKEAEADSCALRVHGNVIPRHRATFYEQLLNYNCGQGQTSAAMLLQVAGASQWDRCEANFFIALHHLADGNRDAAERHFRDAVATRCYGFQAWDWSTVALARLENNRAWPQWIGR